MQGVLVFGLVEFVVVVAAMALVAPPVLAAVHVDVAVAVERFL